MSIERNAIAPHQPKNAWQRFKKAFFDEEQINKLQEKNKMTDLTTLDTMTAAQRRELVDKLFAHECAEDIEAPEVTAVEIDEDEQKIEQLTKAVQERDAYIQAQAAKLKLDDQHKQLETCLVFLQACNEAVALSKHTEKAFTTAISIDNALIPVGIVVTKLAKDKKAK